MKQTPYAHVAILGIDGMGNFDMNADTPHMDALFANGCVNHFALSEDPTISAENWGAMLFGTSPQVHLKTNSYIDKFEHTDPNLPSLFTRVRKAFPDAYLTSVVNWNPINHGIIEHNINADLATADNDEKLLPEILKRIENKPTLLFVQFDDVDGAGHGHTYGQPEHLRQIEISDDYVGQIADAYRKAGIFEDTLFIVLADHGGIRRGHGGYTDEEKYVTFGVSGNTVLKGKMGDAFTRDVCAIALYALGLEIPAYNELGFSSRVPAGVFADEPGYILPKAHEYSVTCRQAIAFDAPNGLKQLFGNRLRLAMLLDNSLKDETGTCEFTMRDTVKFYSSGVVGSRGEFGQTGSAVTGDFRMDSGDFTVGAWIKLDKTTITEDCYVCGNKDWWWQIRRDQGFAFLVKNSDAVFALCNGDDDFKLVTPYPVDFDGGWLHILHVVDKKNMQMRVYMNFKLIRTFAIPEEFAGNVDAPEFTVGNDVPNRHNTELFPNTFNMDDLLIFGDALTEEDVLTLKNYYQF